MAIILDLLLGTYTTKLKAKSVASVDYVAFVCLLVLVGQHFQIKESFVLASFFEILAVVLGIFTGLSIAYIAQRSKRIAIKAFVFNSSSYLWFIYFLFSQAITAINLMLFISWCMVMAGNMPPQFLIKSYIKPRLSKERD